MTRRGLLLALTSADETLARLLHRLYPSSAFLLIDAASGARVASPEIDSDRPIPVGSLLKPFVALAHGEPYPIFDCRACWKPDGHGRIGITEAVAQSCNSYFLALAKACPSFQLTAAAAALGLPAEMKNEPGNWIGLGGAWPVAPLDLLRAYTRLIHQAPPALKYGLRLSAERGTARGVGPGAYAKTGTGPCIHKPKASGDGYAVALWPLDSPRHALLAATHNQPGAAAARLAGGIVRSLQRL